MGSIPRILEYHTIVLLERERWLVRVPHQMFESVVCCHHVYKRVWTPVLGEKLRIVIEEDNNHGARVVAVWPPT